MVRFLVEHGACIFATTLSDHETAAEKCEEDEEGFDGCSEYLYSIQEKLGTINQGAVYAVYDYEDMSPNMTDELNFRIGDKLYVTRKGDEIEREWWWSKKDKISSEDSKEAGYIPRNLLGLHPRVNPSRKYENTTPTNSPSDMENEEDVQSSATERPNNEHEMDLGKEAENADSDDAKMSSS
jgi:apoptosis-stimulating of p53 protein 1